MFAFNVQWQNLLTFDEALQRHGMLREAAERLAKQAKEKAVAQDTAKLIVAHMQDAWNEALGMGDPDSALANVTARAILVMVSGLSLG